MQEPRHLLRTSPSPSARAEQVLRLVRTQACNHLPGGSVWSACTCMHRECVQPTARLGDDINRQWRHYLFNRSQQRYAHLPHLHERTRAQLRSALQKRICERRWQGEQLTGHGASVQRRWRRHRCRSQGPSGAGGHHPCPQGWAAARRPHPPATIQHA